MAGQDPCDGPVASSQQAGGKRPKAAAKEAAAAAAAEAAMTAAASHEAAAPPEAAAADMTTAATPKDASLLEHASFLERLPVGICQELAAFVAPSELAALFAASQGTQRLLAAGVRGWQMRGTGCLGREEQAAEAAQSLDAAAVRVLERLPHLQTFSLTPDAAVGAGSPFLARLAAGSLGAHLRSLRLADLHADALRALTQGLAAGCLPGLTELDVQMDLAHLSHPAAEKERAWGGLPDALAERAHRGLPPLTSVRGVTMLSEGLLRRIWACCPPERVTYLEASGLKQARALGDFLLAHPGFAALRGLVVAGTCDQAGVDRLDDEETSEGGDGASVWRALAMGRCPALETLTITGCWSGERETVVELGKALRRGKLPRLATLELRMTGVRKWGALIDGLVEAQGVPLRRLQLGGALLAADRKKGRLPDAIKMGSGVFGLLEELQWPSCCCDETPQAGALTHGATMLKPLLTGAFCSFTLRSLEVAYVPKPWGKAVVRLLGSFVFPRLTKLTLCGAWVDDEMVVVLVRSLEWLADYYAPPALTELHLQGGATDNRLSTFAALRRLTRAFRNEDALRSLKQLSVVGAADAEAAQEAARWVREWAALGPAVPLEALSVRASQSQGPPSTRGAMVGAARDPSFCPYLRSFYAEGCYAEVTEALGNRWRVRMARAEAAEEAAIVQAGADGLDEFASDFAAIFGGPRGGATGLQAGEGEEEGDEDSVTQEALDAELDEVMALLRKPDDWN